MVYPARPSREQAYWATVALTALLGQIGTPGGGLGFGYACTNGGRGTSVFRPALTRRRECGGQRYPGGAAVRYAAAPGET